MTRLTYPTSKTLVLTFLVALMLPACGRVVGAECREGLELCGTICCLEGYCSAEQVCTALPLDGGADAGFDASDDASDAGSDAGDANVDGGFDAGVDAGPPTGCEIGTSNCGGVCVSLDFDEENCGTCGNACDAGELCVGGSCTGLCDAPLLTCGSACIDPRTDPNNCGACGTVCETEICRRGMCRGPQPGHVVLIGHDYSASDLAETRLLGSAAFIPLEDPLRVIVYEGETTPTAIAGADAAIASVAASIGRDYTRETVTAPLVPVRLLSADVFVVLPQQGETDAALQSLGREWQRSLNSFLGRTGVVIVLDAAGSNEGTWQILSTSGLLRVTGRMDVAAGTELEVIEPTDAVARDVPLDYEAQMSSASFLGTTVSNHVVETTDGAPVVIHRFVIP